MNKPIEGQVIELMGDEYYVLEATGGSICQTVDGRISYYAPPTTLVLKRIRRKNG